MTERIKLENIIEKRKPDHIHPLPAIAPFEFCPICGESIIDEAIVVEYACGDCRNLLEESWEFCPYCSGRVEVGTKVEHYYKGEELSDKKFTEKCKELKIK